MYNPNEKGFSTNQIHAARPEPMGPAPLATPIYQTSTYRQVEVGRTVSGWEYSRTGNPTRAALESLIADLEGGVAGFAFGSGMAAITAVLSLLDQGDEVIIPPNV